MNLARVLLFGAGPVAFDIGRRVETDGGEIVGLGLWSGPDHGPSLRQFERPGIPSFSGADAVGPTAAARYAEARPDIGICSSYPMTLPASLLEVPRWGWVNLHPSYLPYNRGAGALEWAFVDRTPVGVSLHIMDTRINAGPVIAQVQLPVGIIDDRGSMSADVNRAMVDLFAGQWPRLRAGRVEGSPQDNDLSTYHSAQECDELANLDLRSTMKISRLLDLLRAHSGGMGRPARFRAGGARYVVRTSIVPFAQGQARAVEGSARDWVGAGPGTREGT